MSTRFMDHKTLADWVIVNDVVGGTHLSSECVVIDGSMMLEYLDYGGIFNLDYDMMPKVSTLRDGLVFREAEYVNSFPKSTPIFEEMFLEFRGRERLGKTPMRIGMLFHPEASCHPDNDGEYALFSRLYLERMAGPFQTGEGTICYARLAFADGHYNGMNVYKKPYSFGDESVYEEDECPAFALLSVAIFLRIMESFHNRDGGVEWVEYTRQQKRQVKRKTGREPSSHFKWIPVEPGKTQKRYVGGNGAGNGSKKRPHMVRGHFRRVENHPRIPDGTYFIKQHMRGTGGGEKLDRGYRIILKDEDTD